MNENIFERFKKRGYNTYAFSGMPWLARRIAPRGIDVVVEDIENPIKKRSRPTARNAPMCDLVKEFKATVTEPYFAWFQVADTHSPFFTGKKEDNGANAMLNIVGRLDVGKETAPPEVREWLLKNLMEKQIQVVREMEDHLVELSQLGADMIVTADHGENFDPAYRFGHGSYLLNDSLCRVPFVTNFETGDPDKILSTTQTYNILLGRDVQQEYALIEHFARRIEESSWKGISSYRVVTDKSTQNKVYRHGEPFNEEFRKRFEPDGEQKLSRCIQAMEKVGDEYSKTGIVTSGDIDSTVMVYAGSKVFNEMDLIFIDTGLCFQETIDYVNDQADRYDTNLFTARYGTSNRETPEIGSKECCRERKGETLEKIVEEQGFNCVMIPTNRGPRGVKDTVFRSSETYATIYPTYHMDLADLWAITKLHQLNPNLLYREVPRYLDCKPCTKIGPKRNHVHSKPPHIDKEVVSD